MSRYPAPDDDHNRQPLMWLNGHAIYAAYALVLFYVASLFVTTGFMFFRSPLWALSLAFDSDSVLRGQVWRVLTYGLVNQPSLKFVTDMFLIAWIGRELEKFFGRRVFLWFYVCLYLISPLLFTLIGVWQPMGLAGETGALALFVGFATLYPLTALYFGILSWLLAAVLVGIFTLMHLANRDLGGLLSLWATVAFAHGFVRYQQGRFTLPRFKLPSRKPKLRVLPDLSPEEMRQAQPPSNKSMAEMDALLDKIARSGLGSLTAKERARLEQSRAELLKSRGPGGTPRAR